MGVPVAVKPCNFVWIGLTEPLTEEMATLAKAYGLHTLAIEGALSDRQMPKIDVHGDQLFIVTKTAHLEGEPDTLRPVCDLRRLAAYHHSQARFGPCAWDFKSCRCPTAA
jgi:magnesium transporter